MYWGRLGRDRMVVRFTTTYATSAYHHWCCEFKSRSGPGVQHCLMKFVNDFRQVGRWVSPGPPVSSTNKTDRHDIAEILLKVALNALKQTKISSICLKFVKLCFIHFQVLLFLMVSYHVSLRSEFRVVMSVTISA